MWRSISERPAEADVAHLYTREMPTFFISPLGHVWNTIVPLLPSSSLSTILRGGVKKMHTNMMMALSLSLLLFFCLSLSLSFSFFLYLFFSRARASLPVSPFSKDSSVFEPTIRHRTKTFDGNKMCSFPTTCISLFYSLHLFIFLSFSLSVCLCDMDPPPSLPTKPIFSVFAVSR